MDELTSIACKMSYTDLRRRLLKAYRAHSADVDPNSEGDPRLEQKLAAKLGSYGPVGFRLLLIELSEDLPELHPSARRDLAEYAIYLRDFWVPEPVVEVVALMKPDYTPFSVPTAVMTIEPAA